MYISIYIIKLKQYICGHTAGTVRRPFVASFNYLTTLKDMFALPHVSFPACAKEAVPCRPHLWGKNVTPLPSPETTG
jgi:hypothetical protein